MGSGGRVLHPPPPPARGPPAAGRGGQQQTPPQASLPPGIKGTVSRILHLQRQMCGKRRELYMRLID